MNTSDVLFYGHQTVLGTLKDFPADAWETPGVCGVWSVREILAHLASFEQVLVEVLTGFLEDAPTPTLDRFKADPLLFNDVEVPARRDHSPEKVMAEYIETQAKTAHLLERIPLEMRQQNGTLPWYGDEYDLDDFIVYTYYGHKREHCAQVAVFLDELAKDAQLAEAPRRDQVQAAKGTDGAVA